jgi:hypothetical protein
MEIHCRGGSPHEGVIGNSWAGGVMTSNCKIVFSPEGSVAGAGALSNHDVAPPVWRFRPNKPYGLGFAIRRGEDRVVAVGEWAPLPSRAGLAGRKNIATSS